MKKRLKGLLSLWLSLAMVLSLAMPALAASPSKVVLYTGSVPVEMWTSYRTYKEVSDLELGKPLNQQVDYDVGWRTEAPQGWLLWPGERSDKEVFIADSTYYKQLAPDGVVSEEDIAVIPDGGCFVLEPVYPDYDPTTASYMPVYVWTQSGGLSQDRYVGTLFPSAVLYGADENDTGKALDQQSWLLDAVQALGTENTFLSGWKLWSAEDSGAVSVREEKRKLATNDVITKDDFEHNFEYDLVLEPLLLAHYAFTHQPTLAQPYVEVKDNKNDIDITNSEDVSYKWYEAADYVLADKAGDNALGLVEEPLGDYVDGVWKSFDDHGASQIALPFSAQAGDVIEVTILSGGESLLGCMLQGQDDTVTELSESGGKYTCTVEKNGTYFLGVFGDSTFTCSVTVTRLGAAVDGQTAAEFTGPFGTYVCKATVDGVTLFSDLLANFPHYHGGAGFATELSAIEGNPMELPTGSYYLTADLTGKLVIPAGAKVKLCLNGHKIDANGAGSAITVNAGATLDIYDCDDATTHTIDDPLKPGETVTVSGGLITGGTGTGGSGSSTYGGGIYLVGADDSTAQATLNLHGGTVAGNSATDGGGIYMKNATVNLSGGAVSHNTASDNNAGGVCMASVPPQVGNILEVSGSAKIEGNRGVGIYLHNGNLTLSGDASVTGNQGGTGGISVTNSDSQVTMSGNAKVTGNTGTNYGGVCLGFVGKFTVSGGVQITDNTKDEDPNDLTLGNGSNTVTVTIGEGGLTQDAQIGVSLGKVDQGAFTTGGGADYIDNFTSLQKGYFVDAQAEELVMVAYAIENQPTDALPTVTVNSTAGATYRWYSADETTEPATVVCESDTLNTDQAGTYVCQVTWPDGTVLVSNAVTVAEPPHGHDGAGFATELSAIDASPKTLATGSYYLTADLTGSLVIPAGADVTLCLNGHKLDASKENDSDPDRSAITVSAGATLDIYDCNSTHGFYTVDDPLNSDPNVTIPITGGLITGGTGTTVDSQNHGGGIYLDGSASTKTTVNVYGGTIAGNSADFGGGIYAKAATANLYGGAVSYNTGYGVCVDDPSAALNASGESRIEGNQGGGVKADGPVTLSGNATVAGNRSEIVGGINMSTDGGSLTMSDNAKVMNNQGTFNHGGVWAAFDNQVTLSGNVQITDNTGDGKASDLVLGGKSDGDLVTVTIGEGGLQDALIGVSLLYKGQQVFTTGGGASYKDCFTSGMKGRFVTVQKGELALVPYAIEQQPTADEPTVTVNNTEGAVYRWYSGAVSTKKVVADQGTDTTIPATDVHDGTCSDGIWTSVDPYEDGYMTNIAMEFPVQPGDVVTVTPTQAAYMDMISEYMVSVNDFTRGESSYTYTVQDGETSLRLAVAAEGAETFSFTVTVTHIALGATPVDNDATLNTNTEGTYFCQVTWTVDGVETTVTSNPVTVGHDLTHHEAKAATCTQAGNSEYWSCSRCGKYFSDEEGTTEIDAIPTIDVVDHTLTKTDAKDPTCTEDGSKEYWTCSVCRKHFSDSESKNEIAAADLETWKNVSATGHSWDTENWTSDADGHWHKCSNANCPIEKSNQYSTCGESGAAYAEHIYDNGDDTTCNTCSYQRAPLTAHSNPTASDAYIIDYINETIDVQDGYEVNTANDGTGTAVNDGDQVTPGETLYIRKLADVTHSSSAWVPVTVPVRPAAPTAPKAVAETILDKADGKITRLTTAMEYKTDGGWQSATGDLENLAAGTAVTVRFKATDSAFASEERSLTVEAGDPITVTFDSQGGSAVPSITDLSYQGKVKKPETDPTKDGFTFVGWYTEKGCANRWDFDKGQVTQNMTLYAKWVEQVYSVSGNVTDGSSGVDGATVKLMQGNHLAKSTTSTAPDGAYSFEQVPPGVYNVVAEKTESGVTRTVTLLVTVPGDNLTDQDLEMPAGNVNSVLDVKPNTPDVVVGGLKDEADKVKIDNPDAASVTVTMTVESKDASADHADDIQKAAVGKTLEYMDIKVQKEVVTTGGTTSTHDITETTSGLLTIVIPFDSTGKTNITVYRYHQEDGASSGQVDTLPTTDSGDEYVTLNADNITLHVNKFSTYAIGYKKTGNQPTRPTTPSTTPEPEPTLPSWSPFIDVAETDWFHDCVKYAYENELMVGTSETEFSPKLDTSRGMIVTILWNLAGKPEPQKATSFTDVAEGRYYAKAIAWAAENEIVAGYGDGTFGPEDPVTRQQLASILWRYAGSPESTGKLDGFTDAGEVSQYAVPALQWAVEQKIVSGKGNGILDPRGRATRAEAAAMLMKYCISIEQQ